MKKFLILTLILLLPLPCFAQVNLNKTVINDFSGGMNSFSIADILKDSEAASLVNVVISRPGRISKRKGQGLFLKDVGSTPFVGIGRYDPDANTSYLVVASGNTVDVALSNSTEWRPASTSSILTSGKNTEFVQANDLLFALNGFDNTGWYTGSQWISGGDYPSSPPTATTGSWLRNYLFLAGGTTENDWVYISNNLNPRVFSASDIIKINTGDGQKIKHLEAYRLNELIIYKERSIFVLDITGDPPSICSDNCWTVQPISTVIGTPAPRSVVSLGNDQWFLSSEPFGIRSLVRSQFDKILVDMVSQPIQDIFDGTGGVIINKAVIDKAAAVLFDNKFMIALPTGSSTVNNTVLVYDFLVKGWYRIEGWFPTDWVIFDNRLFYIDANDARVIECFTGNVGDWAEGPNTITSASSPTVPINFTYVSKSLDFGEPENYKQLDAISVELDPTGNYHAVIDVNLDNTGWASAGSINLAGSALTLPFTLPATLQNTGISRKTFQLQSMGEFKKMQVRVTQHELTNEQVILQRVTVFSRVKPWRREN